MVRRSISGIGGILAFVLMMSPFVIQADGSQREHAVYDLGTEFALSTRPWRVNRDEFMRRHPRCWFSKDGENRISLRTDCVRFFGMEVCEDTLIFRNGELDRIELSLFNKGISDGMMKGRKTAEIVKAVSEKVKSSRMDIKSKANGPGRTVFTFTWKGRRPFLEASVGETVENGVSSADYMNFTMSMSEKEECIATNPLENLRKKASGDVYIIRIPMANQGQKGYCAPATISRILKYYGIDVGMDELAMVMGTQKGKGTPVGGEFVALTRIAERYGLKRTDYRKFMKYDRDFFARYNAVARDNGGRMLLIEDFTELETIDGEQVLVRCYDKMADAVDKELVRKVRVADKEGFRRFKAGIVEAIDKGYPLFWSVDRLFPWDKPDQSQGDGHARLIVGYNLAKDEVFYSDSWGVEPGFKRAPMSEAWSVTDFLSCVGPK